MYKKKDLIIILILFVVTVISILFFVYTRESFIIGETKAHLDKENRIIFVALPERSDNIQKISFNFLFRNSDVYIKKISYGTTIVEDPVKKRLVNNTTFDFKEYISHSKLIIVSGSSKIEYDLWVTTGDIPIITLDTEGDILDEPKIDCRLSIFSTNSIYMKNSIAAEIELIDISESTPRDSYSLNIKEDIITGDVPDILDLENSKRLKFSTSYMDSSFLREKMSYEIFKMMSVDNIAPDSRYVEVFENNSYKGLFLLSERVDRNMFSLPNYKKNDDIHSVIYEALNWRADFTDGVEGFAQIEPDMDSDGFHFEPLLDLEDFIINAEEDEFLENVEDIIDMDSLIDNHILFLLTGCTNKLASNNYIYRGGDKTDRFSFSPGSLFAASFGRDDSLKKVNSDAIFYGTRLFNRLYEDEGYQERLKNRWNILREKIITVESICNLIDSNMSGLWDARDRNFSGWPVTTDIYKDDYSFNQEIDYIKKFIKDRIDCLDNFINYPPLLRIGNTNAFINEQTNTIFCSIPENSDTTQKITWKFDNKTEIFIAPINRGKYTTLMNDFEQYSDMLTIGDNTDDITISIDSPDELEKIKSKVHIKGWALSCEHIDNTGVEKILVFDGPEKNKSNFLGAANIKYFSTQFYKYCKFNLTINALYLENGKHELYIYAYDNKDNYSVTTRQIEVSNPVNLVSHLENPETVKLVNGKDYNFKEFIFHGIITIKNEYSEKQYDFYLTNSDIPLVIIETENKSIPNDNKMIADMLLIYNDSNEKNFIDRANFNFTGKIGIELRGKSTLGFPKKQYSIETRDDYGNDRDVSLLGMPSESDWVLSAPYTDKTLIRMPLAFELSNQMGLYASRTRFVELFLDDGGDQIIEEDYRGIYVLTERIKRDKDRIDIERLDSDDENLISGGYILEMISTGQMDPHESYIETSSGRQYINKYPNWAKITDKQKEYITDYMDTFEKALYGENFRDKEEGYLNYIDIDSFIDYIIINELFKNRDIFEKSTFINKERNGKLKLGPIWDFDLSAGNISENPNVQINQPQGFKYPERMWCNRLFLDPYFVNKYISRWKKLREDVLSNDNIENTIDLLVLELAEAQERNFKKWQILGKRVWPNPKPYARTHKEAVDKLENWLLIRAEWIDNNIDSLHHEMTCSRVFVNDNGCFEFEFLWEYDNNNWVKLYDIDETEVFSIDMPLGVTIFEACLPDGMYTVRTFHGDMSTPIQEFIIGKP